jgi:membrane-bound lytic murein transglycosylase D
MILKRSNQALFAVAFGLALSGCANLFPPLTAEADSIVKKEDRATAGTPAKAAPIVTPSAEKETHADAPAAQEAPTYPDIWARMRAGFSMEKLDGGLVAIHEQWFQRNPEYMARMMDRARPYLFHIVEEIEKRGLPTELALLPAIESAYQPYAASRAKAVGLWQFIAPTGKLYGLKINWWHDGRRDVEASTTAALDYLEKLYNEFDGDWHLALAAYNAGEGKINRMQQYNRNLRKPTDYQSLKLKRETVNYVPKFQAMVNIIKDPAKYGVVLADIPNKPYFTRVPTGSQIDLGVVAKLTDLPLSELQVINPAHTRWATDPEGPHHVLVPVDKKETLEEALSKLPLEERVQWKGYDVKRGDSLHDVAKKFGVSVEAIREANGLKTNLLRAGQALIIPVSTRPLTPYVPPVPIKAAPGTTPDAPVFHQVKSGETLSSIARRYNVLVHQLAKWNLLDPTDILKLGQRLRIWPKGAPTALLENALPESGG